eukprot:8021973-Prorocentrum_lima.AAC.1
MTSSLVGSEMCIRDRCSREQGSRQRRLQDACVKLAGTPECCLDASVAVSYTHLTLPTICSV